MLNIFLTKQALQDLGDIKKFISLDNAYFAGLVIERIFSHISLLSSFPHIGKESDSGTGHREIIEPTHMYRIIYCVENDEVWILTVGKYKNI